MQTTMSDIKGKTADPLDKVIKESRKKRLTPLLVRRLNV